MNNLIPYRLFESLSDVLYHFCGTDRAKKMIEDDRFALAISPGTVSDANINKGKMYYMSFTRSGSGDLGYARTIGARGLVRIKVDGVLLGSKVHGEAVDYWQRPRDMNNPMYGSMHAPDKRHRLLADDEMEDRIMADKPFIPGARKMIKQVDVCMEHPHYDGKVQDFEPEMLHYCWDLKDQCDKYNIEFRFFSDRKQFDRMHGGETIPPRPTGEREKPYDFYGDRWGNYFLTWCIAAGQGDAVKKLIDNDELYNALEKQAKEEMKNLAYGTSWIIDDKSRHFDAQLHNDKAYKSERISRSIEMLLKIMKSLGTRDSKSFMSKMQEKARAALEGDRKPRV